MGLLFNWRLLEASRTGWGVDFNQFYAAGHLAGTRKLYDWDALRREELKHGIAVHTARLPVVAFGVKSISWLPYSTAHWLWLGLSSLALVLLVLAWPDVNKAVMFTALAWSAPAALLLLLGQDTPFWLLFYSLGFAMLRRERNTLAGIVFALCLCKFHLAAAVPVILIARGNWRSLLAGASATALLLASCFLIEGPQWPRQYLAVLTDPMLSPAADRMPNLRGIASRLPLQVWIELALAVLVIVLLWRAARSIQNLGWLAALGAACGLILAPHGYANDCALFVPLCSFVVAAKTSESWLRIWALLLITPLPLLLLASDKPLVGQLLIVGFVFAILFHSPSHLQPIER